MCEVCATGREDGCSCVSSRPRVGSLVEYTLEPGRMRRGVVIDVSETGKGKPPWLTILFNEGELWIKSPRVRVIVP